MPKAQVGTSGWSYATWKPKFYPAGTKSADFLRYYATRLRTLEVNYTFNHLPTQKNVDGWVAATGDDFFFALKASQRITHVKQLGEPADSLPPFFERARLLGARLGPVLFQTPPWLKRDDERLAMFVASLPTDLRCVMEFRSDTWYVDEVYDLLALRNVALVHAEGEKAPSPLATIGRCADFVYIRLRAASYDEATLQAWAARLREQLTAGKDVYAYFRHDEDGSNALSAERLRDLLAA